MALDTLQSIDAEIKQLEAQKKLIEKRDSDVPKALETLQKYAKVLTSVQRRQVARLIGEAIEAPAAKQTRGPKKAAKKGIAKGTKLGKVPMKYRIPTGGEWSGRGHMPTAFTAWFGSAEGKAWKKANPDLSAPLIAGKAAKKTAKVAKKATKKAAKKSAKKAVKKAAKKAVAEA